MSKEDELTASIEELSVAVGLGDRTSRIGRQEKWVPLAGNCGDFGSGPNAISARKRVYSHT